MRFIGALLIAAAACAQEQPPVQLPPGQTVPPPSDCTIDGTVVDYTTHAPVPRAKIVLRGNGVLKDVTADNMGRWSLTGLPCVAVDFDVSRFGYLDSHEGADRPVAVMLTHDSPAHIDVELMPQSVVTGAVLDENGDPVTARVVAHPARVIDGRRVFSSTQVTTTNDLGEFRLAELPPGNYIFCADPLAPAYHEACYPAPLTSGAASAMLLTPGQQNEADFVLASAKPVTVSGTVTGIPEGSGSTVQLLPADGGAGPHPAIGVSRDGSFRLFEVSPGSYVLFAQARGSQNSLLTTRLPVEVGRSDVTGLEISLAPPAPIVGVIGVDSDRAPSDLTGRFELSLIASEPTFGPLGHGGAQIAFADGGRSFTIAGLPFGSYTLRFRSDQYFLESATLDGTDISHGEFTINGPGSMNIVISDRGGSLDGDVILDDGSPATTASVILLRNGQFARIVPVTNGHFNTRNLQPGDYTATAWDNTRNVAYADPDWMRQYSDRATAFTVTAGQDANAKLIRITAPRGY